MVYFKHLFLFMALGALFSCSEDDLPETEDPNLFMGVWKLESSVRNNVAQTLTDCNKESTLILFWFSEADPNYNAEIHTYEVNASGECIVVQQIIDASWRPVTIFDAEGGATAEVPLSYTIGDTLVSLELSIENNILTLQGEMPIDGEMVFILNTYRQLQQEI
ncbi:MAG: hypothetical protein AAGC45_10455 [Bacteroidota bacterium]